MRRGNRPSSGSTTSTTSATATCSSPAGTSAHASPAAPATGCPCHRHPDSGHLAIDEDQTRGRLGLVSPAAGGCHCCEPWTAYELADVLRDLAHIEALSHGGGCQLAEGTSCPAPAPPFPTWPRSPRCCSPPPSPPPQPPRP